MLAEQKTCLAARLKASVFDSSLKQIKSCSRFVPMTPFCLLPKLQRTIENLPGMSTASAMPPFLNFRIARKIECIEESVTASQKHTPPLAACGKGLRNMLTDCKTAMALYNAQKTHNSAQDRVLKPAILLDCGPVALRLLIPLVPATHSMLMKPQPRTSQPLGSTAVPCASSLLLFLLHHEMTSAPWPTPLWRHNQQRSPFVSWSPHGGHRLPSQAGPPAASSVTWLAAILRMHQLGGKSLFST